jgi:hypothetical protein
MIASGAMTAGPVPAPTLFGATGSSSCPSNLYSIDPTTGAATLIGPIVAGPTNFCFISAMDFDPTTRILYAQGYEDGVTGVLLTIDPTTGAATVVGPSVGLSGNGDIADMSFRSDGALYAMAGGGGLGNVPVYTIDKSTGTVTLLGPSNTSGSGNGIAFSPSDVLFHANGTDLHTLDQTTGAATLVAGLTWPSGPCSLAGHPRVAAMDFQPGTGTLFGVLNHCGDSVWHLGTIDTATGDVTDIGQTVDKLDAIAFQPPSRILTALSPAKLWVGLKNSDDVGLRLDLKAEVFINSTSNPPVGTGELDNVSSGSSGFSAALLNTINLALTGSPALSPGDQLLFRASVRRTCTGGGHAAGTARLWYNGAAIDSGAARDAGSRFDASINGTSINYYLRTGFVLSTTAGTSRTSIDKFVDSSASCPNRPFVAFGTWNVAP